MDWPERRFQITHAVEEGLFLRRLDGERPRGTLFYVHGLGESALCFERLMAEERLGRWNHLAADLAGYGKSAWAAEPLGLEQHAARLEELLAAVHPDPVVVLGHSMGGVVGTLLAERAGRRVRAFVNVEGNVSLADCIFSSRAARYTPEAWLAEGYGQVLDGLHAEERERPAVMRPYCASIAMCDPRAFHRNAGELVEIAGAETLAPRLAAIDRPVTYIFGAPRGIGDHSRGLLARAGVDTAGVADAGHWPFLDHQRAFVDLLAAFLDRLEPIPADR